MEKRRETTSIEHVLISMGGVDADNCSQRVLQIIEPMVIRYGWKVTVLLGRDAPFQTQVAAQLKQLDSRGCLLTGTEQVAEQMWHCDLAIGAAGTTAWERCCLGLPTLLFCAADNQLATAQLLERCGAAIFIGFTADFESRSLIQALTLFENDFSRYQSMSRSAFELCDGMGTRRVVRELLDDN